MPYIFAFILLVFFQSAFAHNLLERREEHFYINTGYVDFVNSTIKKYGYTFHLKYGLLLKKRHNIILDHREGFIKTNLDKNLKIKKYALGYQYIYGKYRFIFNVLYVDDNLVQEADDLKVYGAGIGYENIEIKQYVEDFKHFNVYETDFKYFFSSRFFKGAILGKYINIGQRKYISKNASARYLSAGVIIHGNIKKFHYGFGGLFGNRVFSILDNGSNIQHHPFEFRYSFFFKIGLETKFGIIHSSLGYAKAKELPFNNPEVKIKSINIDYSVKF